LYETAWKVSFLDLDYKVKFYGSCTVGERGQVVLPIEARKRFGIKPGDKLVVVSADSKDFEKIVLVKSESMARMLSLLTDYEGVLKGNPKDFQKMYKEGIGKIKAALNESGAKGLKQGRARSHKEAGLNIKSNKR
jgi:AbrB family looped-hinge helix DNA binding protein